MGPIARDSRLSRVFGLARFRSRSRGDTAIFFGYRHLRELTTEFLFAFEELSIELHLPFDRRVLLFTRDAPLLVPLQSVFECVCVLYPLVHGFFVFVAFALAARTCVLIERFRNLSESLFQFIDVPWFFRDGVRHFAHLRVRFFAHL